MRLRSPFSMPTLTTDAQGLGLGFIGTIGKLVPTAIPRKTRVWIVTMTIMIVSLALEEKMVGQHSSAAERIPTVIEPQEYRKIVEIASAA